jgi:protocatechuate 3,4-dioxygenase beta subunit
VLLSGADLIAIPAAVTDEAGRFSFEGLPPGRFALLVRKPGYLPGWYGSDRPGRLGTRLVLQAGQDLTAVEITLFRGSAIAGAVRDELDVPVDGAQVLLGRHAARTGQGAPPLLRVWSAVTDDRGRYRFFGLPPGEFEVTVFPPRVAESRPAVQVLEPGDVDRIIAAGGRGGSVVGLEPSNPVPADWVPVTGYLPASTTEVYLGLGEERHLADVRLRRGRLSTIAGAVTTAEGRPAASVRITVRPADKGVRSPWLSRTTTTAGDGTFAITNLVPGPYSVVARRISQNNAGTSYWAATSLAVTSGVTQATLVLRPGGTVSGRFVFDSVAEPVEIRRVALGLRLMALELEGEPTNTPRITGDDGDTFQFRGIAPGRYYLANQPIAEHGWFLTDASNGAVSLIEPPYLEVRGGEVIENVAISFTRQPTELRGTVIDAEGRPSSDYSVVVFPREEALWDESSFRVRETTPGSDGTYAFRGLPPGQYLVSLRTEDWPGVTLKQILPELVPFAVPVTITATAPEFLNLQIR